MLGSCSGSLLVVAVSVSSFSLKICPMGSSFARGGSDALVSLSVGVLLLTSSLSAVFAGPFVDVVHVASSLAPP